MFNPVAWRPAPCPFAWWVALPAAWLLAITGALPAVLTIDPPLWLGMAQFVLVGALALGLIRLGAGRLDRRTAGFEQAPPARALVVGLAGLGVFYAGMAGLEALKGDAAAAAQNEGVRRMLGLGEEAARDAVAVLTVTLLAPLAEELAFRALMFRALRDGLAQGGFLRRAGGGVAPGWLSLLIALAVSAAAFVSVHGGTGQEGLALEYALFAAVMALSFHLTGMIAVPIVLHALINTVSLLEVAGLDGAAFADHRLVWLVWAGPVLALAAALGLGALTPPARTG